MPPSVKAVVSGAGNGAAMAIVFARKGAKVVLADAVEECAEVTEAIIEDEVR